MPENKQEVTLPEEPVTDPNEGVVADAVEQAADETIHDINDPSATKTIEGDDHHTTAPTQAASTKKGKHHKAVAKVDQAKQAIEAVDAEIEACMQKVQEDLDHYKDLEHRFVEERLKPGRQMLRELGADEVEIVAAPEPIVDLEDPEVKPVEIGKLSSGRLAGLTYGLLGGIVGLGAWCYTATQALKLPLLPTTFPDMERIHSLLGWTAQQFGQGDNVGVGGSIVGVGFVLIVAILYWITTSIKGTSNLKKAEKIEADTEFYCTKKSECKTQMKKVRDHIAQAQRLIEEYDVLLSEQNARIARARFFEEGETYHHLHARTQEDVRTLKHLATTIERFMETPMSQNGILSHEGIEALEQAKKLAKERVEALYR
jgi:hypothetical protein